MADIIIIGIIVVLVLVGLRSSIKHFKGEGDCCGGGSYKKKQKKLRNVVARKTVIVEGMTCEHCKNRVEECIDDMDGAAGKVNLKKKELIVSMEKEISDEQIRKAIERVGYSVVEIK